MQNSQFNKVLDKEKNIIKQLMWNNENKEIEIIGLKQELSSQQKCSETEENSVIDQHESFQNAKSQEEVQQNVKEMIEMDQIIIFLRGDLL